MLLSKMCSKDVVDVRSGERLGKIRDMEIDLGTGNIKYLIVSPHQSISSLIKRHKIQIKFKDIEKIGEEVILVNRTV